MDNMQGGIARLENDVSGLKSEMAEVKLIVARMEERLSATLPHLATKSGLADIKAELAEKPSTTYMWGVMAALLTAYACGLAALAVLR